MAEALKAQGNASFKEGRYDHAVGYFTSAIDLDGTNAVLFSNRSGAHASLGHFDKALSDADKTVPRLPPRPPPTPPSHPLARRRLRCVPTGPRATPARGPRSSGSGGMPRRSTPTSKGWPTRRTTCRCGRPASTSRTSCNSRRRSSKPSWTARCRAPPQRCRWEPAPTHSRVSAARPLTRDP